MTTPRRIVKTEPAGVDGAARPRTVKAADQGLQIAYRRWRDFLNVSLERSIPRNEDEACRVVACFRSFGMDQPATLDRDHAAWYWR